MTKDLIELHCQQLNKIREAFFRPPHSGLPMQDRRNVTIVLDGSQVSDIPTFFIALGKAANGPGGYYGGCLDSLNDCLCGGFGLSPPFTLEVTRLEHIREVVNSSEDVWYERLRKQWKKEDWYDDSEAVAESHESPFYFDKLMAIFAERRVTVREYGQSQ